MKKFILLLIIVPTLFGETVKLKDGTVIEGEITRRSAEKITVMSPSLGIATYTREKLTDETIAALNLPALDSPETLVLKIEALKKEVQDLKQANAQLQLALSEAQNAVPQQGQTAQRPFMQQRMPMQQPIQQENPQTSANEMQTKRKTTDADVIDEAWMLANEAYKKAYNKDMPSYKDKKCDVISRTHEVEFNWRSQERYIGANNSVRYVEKFKSVTVALKEDGSLSVTFVN